MSPPPPAEIVKPGWGECPPADLPLREWRPAISRRTGERLIRFALCQPRAVGEWLLARADAYLTRDHGTLADAENMAALDLLAWQSGGLADRAALARLPDEREWNNQAQRPEVKC